MEPRLNAHNHHLHDLLYCLVYDYFHLMYHMTKDTCVAALAAQNFQKKKRSNHGVAVYCSRQATPKEEILASASFAIRRPAVLSNQGKQQQASIPSLHIPYHRVGVTSRPK
jgi:hypothetical protein